MVAKANTTLRPAGVPFRGFGRHPMTNSASCRLTGAKVTGAELRHQSIAVFGKYTVPLFVLPLSIPVPQTSPHAINVTFSPQPGREFNDNGRATTPPLTTNIPHSYFLVALIGTARECIYAVDALASLNGCSFRLENAGVIFHLFTDVQMPTH